MAKDWSKLPKWAQQDLEDMSNSRCTRFQRCNNCGRLSDDGYLCFYCGHDNSIEEANNE